MKRSKRVCAATLVLIGGLLAGCGGYHLTSYRSVFDSDGATWADSDGLDYREVADVQSESRALYAEGYVMIGYSQFVSPLVPGFAGINARNAGRLRGAHVVVQNEARPVGGRSYSYVTSYWKKRADFVLGAYYTDLPPDVLGTMGCENNTVLVQEVAVGTPASKAGLKTGDILLALDGKHISDAASLDQMLQAKAGSEIELGFWRDDSWVETRIPLGSAPEPTPDADEDPDETLLGVVFGEELLPSEARELAGGSEGVVLKGLFTNTPACSADLLGGSVVLEAGGEPVRESKDLLRAVEEARGGELSLRLFQEGQVVEKRIPLVPTGLRRLSRLAESLYRDEPWRTTDPQNWSWLLPALDAVSAAANQMHQANMEIARQENARREQARQGWLRAQEGKTYEGRGGRRYRLVGGQMQRVPPDPAEEAAIRAYYNKEARKREQKRAKVAMGRFMNAWHAAEQHRRNEALRVWQNEAPSVYLSTYKSYLKSTNRYYKGPM